MPQKQVSVINQEILDNNMPSTLITFTPNPTPTHYACIFIMYLDCARFLRLLSRVFEMRESIYLSCAKLIITRMFISACETPCIKKYQAP